MHVIILHIARNDEDLVFGLESDSGVPVITDDREAATFDSQSRVSGTKDALYVTCSSDWCS